MLPRINLCQVSQICEKSTGNASELTCGWGESNREKGPGVGAEDVGDGDHHDLPRGEPEGELALVALEQDGAHALDAAEHRAVDHHLFIRLTMPTPGLVG